jgi:hypothetical protein
MTRTILASAAALVAAATLFASAAQACISCSYVPPVVNTPVYGAKHCARPRVYTAVRTYRAAKRRVVESEPRVKRVNTAKVAEPAPETAPVSAAAVNENSSIAVAKVEAAQIETAKPVKLEPVKREAAAKVDCKKFFPSVGMTLTVPCE